MELWTAFLLGLLGSAHCAGMCGPLALALPGAGNSPQALLVGRLGYNAGRIVTYTIMGALFGLLGRGFELAGIQRWVSLTLGAIILTSLFVSKRLALGFPATKAVGWLKGVFGKLLHRRTVGSLLLIGMLNGLLPCGLVYVACAAATSTGSLAGGTGYMVAFGLGTVPMMLGLSLAGAKVQFRLRLRLQRLIPVSLGIVGCLLLLRGMALGIPYISPDLAASGASCCAH